jgi:hypothetical protein
MDRRTQTRMPPPGASSHGGGGGECARVHNEDDTFGGLTMISSHAASMGPNTSRGISPSWWFARAHPFSQGRTLVPCRFAEAYQCTRAHSLQ